jgi:1-acyl-sn-glycerol-3-phosphate acyltransferase
MDKPAAPACGRMDTMSAQLTLPGLPARLNRSWRQLAAGFCFLIFWLCAIVVGTLLIPAARLFARGPARRAAVSRAIIRGGMRLFWWTMLTLRLFRCEIRGLEHLRGERILVVANHPTLIDAVLLLGLVEDAVVVAKRALAENPITGPAVSAAGYIVNSEGPALVAEAAQTFARGGRVLVFPESTRTPPGSPVRLQRGAANIAVRTGCKVVAVTIRVSNPLLYKGAPWHAMPLEMPRFDVEVQPPFEVGEIVAAHDSLALAARDLNDRLQRFYDTEMAASGAA